MRSILFSSLTILAGFALCGGAKADIIADHVNDTFSADNGAFWGANDVGWLYAPSFNYNLSGINTEFSIPNGTIVENRIVTVVLYQNASPADGGLFLGSFQFDSATAEGTLGGGSFGTPIALTAGQTYFVGFEDVGPLSPTPNVDDIGVNFTASGSATFLSNLHLDSVTNGACPTVHTFACVDPNADILGQPILQFLEPNPLPPPTAPEPASVLLFGSGFAGLAGWARFRSRRA